MNDGFAPRDDMESSFVCSPRSMMTTLYSLNVNPRSGKPHMVRCRGWATLLVGIILLLGYGWDCSAQRRFLTPADVNALPSKPPDHRLFYGRGSLQFGDLRLPEGSGPYPVAIVIHGGCWLSRFADVRNTAALADALRDAGIATWNIEYRRLDDSGGGWPGTFQDVARATDYLRSIAEKYHLDLHRVVVIGHSSGGHLALWVAARHRLPRTSAVYTPRPLPVRGVIALGGPGDLKRFMRHARSVCGDHVVTKLLGGSPDEVPDRYRQASPIELLPLGVPQILITGKYDRAVPPEYGQAYAEAARKSGDTVRHIIVDRAAHHEYNAPQAVTWPVIKSAVFSLLQLDDSGSSNEHQRGHPQ